MFQQDGQRMSPIESYEQAIEFLYRRINYERVTAYPYLPSISKTLDSREGRPTWIRR